MLTDKEGTHPAHIGIVQIQHRKLIQIFCELSEKNWTFNYRPKNDQYWQRKQHRVDASTQEFPSAVNTQYFRHFKKAIERKTYDEN